MADITKRNKTIKDINDNYVGKQFYDLTILEFAGYFKETQNSKREECYVKCKCICGVIKDIPFRKIKCGNTKSCGCRKSRVTTQRNFKHGFAKRNDAERLYTIWEHIKARCFNKNDEAYKYYGGRGITMCDEWKNDYLLFRKWAYENGYDENKPKSECSIDRIDVNGNYEPSNCRWANDKMQMNNTTKNYYITYNGETHTMSEWADIFDINYYTIRSRIRYGLPLEKVFFKGSLRK